MLETDVRKDYYMTEEIKVKVVDMKRPDKFRMLLSWDGKDRPKPLFPTDIKKVVKSPQSVIADEVQQMPVSFAKKFARRDWDKTIIDLALKIRDAKNMDPIVQLYLLKQVFEFGGKGSYPLASALRGPLKTIEEANLDLMVPWMEPNNEAAARVRPRAEKYVKQFAGLHEILKQAAEKTRDVNLSLKQSHKIVIGWLARDKKTGWMCRTNLEWKEAFDLYVVTMGRDQKPTWQPIGRIREGVISIDAPDPESLLEGRIVFGKKVGAA